MALSMDLSESDASYIRDFLSKAGALSLKNNVSLSDDGGLDLSLPKVRAESGRHSRFLWSVRQSGSDHLGRYLRQQPAPDASGNRRRRVDNGIVIDECSSIAVREDVDRKLRITTLLSTDDTYYAKDISKGRVDTLTKIPTTCPAPLYWALWQKKTESAIALFTSTTFMLRQRYLYQQEMKASS